MHRLAAAGHGRTTYFHVKTLGQPPGCATYHLACYDVSIFEASSVLGRCSRPLMGPGSQSIAGVQRETHLDDPDGEDREEKHRDRKLDEGGTAFVR